MNTRFLLLAQYGGKAVIPLDEVRRDYFPHVNERNFLAKLASRDIKIPVVRTDPSSQKSMRGIHVDDLATFIDARRAVALREFKD
jgi:hypothetical protein